MDRRDLLKMIAASTGAAFVGDRPAASSARGTVKGPFRGAMGVFQALLAVSGGLFELSGGLDRGVLGVFGGLLSRRSPLLGPFER